MEKVSIRLIRCKDIVYSIAQDLSNNLNLNWIEYPVYLDKDQKIVCKDKIALYATIFKKPELKTVKPSLLDFS